MRGLRRICLAAVLAVVALPAGTVRAQVVRDGTIGPSAAVQPTGPAYEIPQSMGQTVGTSLFHSFRDLSFTAPESLTFFAAPQINNIFARVTGGQPSLINGRITAPANLFLMNPYGLMFGAGASLDIAGSFHATTADYIGFSTGERFTAAVGGSVPLLAVAAPTAFGFLSNAPAPLSVSGSTLQMQTGRSLSLVGGPTTISGAHLKASGGDIHIAALAGPGTVPMDLTPSRDARFADVDLVDRSTIESTEAADSRIFIRAGTIRIGEGSALRVAPRVDAGTSSIEIDASRDVVVAGSVTAISDTTTPGPPIKISAAEDVIVQGSGTVRTDAFENANGGDLTVIAGRDLILEDLASLETVAGDGKGGAISAIAGRDLQMSGNGVHPVIHSDVIFDGQGGSIALAAQRVLMLPGARIANGTSGEGAAGSVIISASDSIVIDGGSLGNTRTGISAQNVSSNDASVGNVFLYVPDGLLTVRGASINVNGVGTAGGILRVEARAIELRDNAMLSAFGAFEGAGGTVILRVGERFVSYQSTVSVKAFVQSPRAGNVAITSPIVLLLDSSQVLAPADEGSGGNIWIDAGLFLKSNDSSVSAESLFGAEGTVTIAPPDVDIAGTVSAPPLNFVDAAELLRQRCASQRPGTAGSFVVRGRFGTPPAPDGLLPAMTPTGTALTPEGLAGVRLGTTPDKRPVILAIKCGE